MKTNTIPGKDVAVGDSIQLEDGLFAKVTGLDRAPMRIQYDDGSFAKSPRWAYLDRGGWATICADDQVTVAA